MAETPPSPDDIAQLRGLITGYFTSRALYAAAALDIAGVLAAGPLRPAELAARLGCHGPSLYRLLRALAASGVFREDAEGRFANTALSGLLRDGVPGSLRYLTLLMGDETSWRAWEAILHGIRTGEAPFEHVYGEKFFDYLQDHHDAAAMFDRAMASASSTTNAAVVEACDFCAYGTVVDVAGGTGSALCSILEATPGIRGIVFDLPHVEARAKAHIESRHLSGRCEFVGGSFFEAVPPGAGAYFMKHILHDWGDAECTDILRTCHRAMGAGSRLLVCERIVPPGNEPSSAKLIDLHMLMTNHGGKERTLEEYRKLFGEGGFALERVIPTSTPWSVLEAKPQ
jgi:hypothetical protein